MGAHPKLEGREVNCPGKHKKGCDCHLPQMVNGKPWRLADHKDELTAEGLTSKPPLLVKLTGAKKPPPGKPKMVGSTLVYPKPNFGQPARSQGSTSSA